MTAPSRLPLDLSQLPGTIRWGHSLPAPAQGGAGLLATGHPEIDDLLGGGFPRGRLCEVVSHGSAGATSLAQRLLAGVTREEHLAAWVDVADAFDPASAVALGVELRRVLWVRPPDLAAALAATEMLLGTGGFALVLLDAARTGRQDPGAGKGRRMLSGTHTWLRLARAATRSQTALVVLPGATAGAAGLAGAAAGMRLDLSPVRAVWEGAPGAPPLLEGLVTRIEVARHRGDRGGGERRASIRLV